MRAVLFDFDGLLVDSEPLWRRTEVEHFATVGLSLTEADCEQTTGLRIDEVVAQWFRRHPWSAPTPEVITARIVDTMVARLAADPPVKPGARHAIEVCHDAGLRLAVASSSPSRLLEAGLAGMGMRDRFELVVSAEHERFGKPHPAVLLRTADALGVSPLDCLVLEDSFNGCLAAKAARMRCVVVPESDDRRFVIADRILPTLEALDAATLAALAEE